MNRFIAGIWLSLKISMERNIHSSLENSFLFEFVLFPILIAFSKNSTTVSMEIKIQDWFKLLCKCRHLNHFLIYDDVILTYEKDSLKYSSELIRYSYHGNVTNWLFSSTYSYLLLNDSRNTPYSVSYAATLLRQYYDDESKTNLLSGFSFD